MSILTENRFSCLTEKLNYVLPLEARVRSVLPCPEPARRRHIARVFLWARDNSSPNAVHRGMRSGSEEQCPLQAPSPLPSSAKMRRANSRVCVRISRARIGAASHAPHMRLGTPVCNHCRCGLRDAAPQGGGSACLSRRRKKLFSPIRRHVRSEPRIRVADALPLPALVSLPVPPVSLSSARGCRGNLGRVNGAAAWAPDVVVVPTISSITFWSCRLHFGPSALALPALRTAVWERTA